MGNRLLRRVGAVENAFCAFSKELVGAFCASTGPAASTRGSALLPQRGDSTSPVIKASQHNRSEIDGPLALVELFQRDVLAGERRTHKQIGAAPGDAADARHATDVEMAGVVQRGHAWRERPPRWRVATA